jgi:transcriptional regulator with XRE-family HTH domain
MTEGRLRHMSRPERSLYPERSALDKFGYELRRYRKARGISQDEHGALVHVSGDLVYRIEIADRRPSRQFAELSDRVLNAGGELIELCDKAEDEWQRAREARNKLLRIDTLSVGIADDRTLLTPWTVEGTLVGAREISEVNPVDRRSFLFLTGTALTAPAHEWLIAHRINDVSSSAGRVIEPWIVDDLDGITGKLRHMDDQMGGGALINIVRAQTGYVASLLREGRYTDSTGRRLHGTLGELLRLGGWVSYDGGDQARAQRFWIAALHSAHTAGDTALGANILGFMSEPARDTDRPDDAVNLAETALAGYKGSSPRVSAILYMQAALAHAVKGDKSECRHAIDSAYSAFRNSPSESGEPEWCYWMDERRLNAMIGTCFLPLKDYSSACNYLELSLPERGQQNIYVRDGVVSLTRLATACAQDGEPERACDFGTRAIDTLSSQVDSARLIGLAQRLRDDLGPYRRVSAVQEFSDRVDSLAHDSTFAD